MKKILYGLVLLGMAGNIMPASAAEVSLMVAKCHVKDKKCAPAAPVVELWPALKGTPPANVVNGGIDPNSGYITLFSALSVGLFNPEIDKYLHLSDTLFSTAPEFLHKEGADVVFDGINYRSIYVKNDTAAYYDGSGTPGKWSLPQRLSNMYPGLAGTLFSGKLDAAVPVPGSGSERIFIFAGGYIATLNLNTRQFDGDPRPVTEVFSGLWEAWRGVYGAFSLGDDYVYLFSYLPQA